MKKISKKHRIIIYICGLVVVLFSFTNVGLSFWLGVEKFLGTAPREKIADDYNFTVHFLDVAKADCALIESPNAKFMIDGGTPYYSQYVKNYLHKRGINKLDAIIVTHFDYDHYSGFLDILEEIDTDVIYTNGEDISKKSTEMVELINRKNIEVKTLTAGDKLYFGELLVDVISPSKVYEGSNENSLVTNLVFEDFKVLMTGDLENEALDDLVDLNIDLSADVLKIPHHGSENGLSEEFLDLVKPELCIVSSGENSMNLPSPKVLDLMESLNYEYYWTAHDGTIIVTTNADKTIKISTREGIYEKTYD